MPWYWTDDLARTLLASGQIDPDVAQRLTRTPVAIWGADSDKNQTSEETADDDDLPQVA